MSISDDIKDIVKSNPKFKSAIDELGSDSHHIYPLDCPPIDIAIGGGVMSGKIYEIYGWEGSCKSTLALEITKAFAKYWDDKGDDKYGILYIETESALDKVRAKWMGCPIDRFIIDEAECIEDGHENIKGLLERCCVKGMKFLIVWDTIGATSTRKEKEKGPNAGGMAERARLARLMFRDLTTLLGKTDSTLILVNQSQVTLGGFIPGEDSPIPAIKFHASVRICLSKKTDRKVVNSNGTEQVIGINSELFTVKNKLTLPKQKSMISVLGETGLDIFDTNYQFIVKNELIQAKTAWKTIEFPEVVGKPEMTSLKFQSPSQLKEKMEMQYPHLKEWINYLIYRFSSNTSPLLKVKIINKIWEYEMMFFNEKRTILTEKEIEIASIIHREINAD